MDRAYRFSVTDTGAAGAGIINGGVYLHEAGRVKTSDCGTGRSTDWRRLYDMGSSTSVHSSGSEGATPTRWPPKPRVARNEGAAWSSGFRLLMHYARSSRKTGNRALGGKGKGPRPYHH